MANVKITDLTAYADPVSTDVLPVVDVTADTTKKVSIATLLKNASLGTAALPGIAFDGDPNTGLYSPGADQVAVVTDGFERIRITSAGLVGIGASSPSNTAGFVQQVQLAGSLPCFTIEQSNGSYTLRKYSIGIDAVGGLGFWDNAVSAYRFYIDTSGQIGLGTSSPTALLHVAGTSIFQGLTTFQSDARLTGTGYLNLPAGTTAQRPGSPNLGMLRYNTTLTQFEGYNGTAWGQIGGGATGGGTDAVFLENGQTVTTNYTITNGKNAVSAGPITINSGVTVTVPSGASWAIV